MRKYAIVKKSSLILLLFALACGRANTKKGNAVYNSSTEMSEDEFRDSLSEKRIQAPIAPVNEIKNPPPAPAVQNNDQDSTSKTQSEKAPGVGVFTTIVGKTNGLTSYSHCTATLISENEIITASHCVPENEKGPQAYCSKMAFNHSKESKTFGCSKVLWSTLEVTTDIERKNTSTSYADFMIIQLDGSPKNIQFHKLSTTPIKFSEKYKILVYSPDKMNFPDFKSGNDLAEMDKNSFHYYFAAYNACSITDIYPSGYPFRTFNCPIVGGNSGASVFNNRGEINGVVGGCVDPVDKLCLNGNKGGYLTDTSCIQKINGKYQWSSSCPTSGPLSSTATIITNANR